MIGERIREARAAAGLTQQQLATLAGVSVVHVSRLERAQADQPRRAELESVARALGLTADDLMGFEDAPAAEVDEETEEQLDAELDELTRDADLVLAFMSRVRDPKQLSRAAKLAIRDDLRRLRARQQRKG